MGVRIRTGLEPGFTAGEALVFEERLGRLGKVNNSARLLPTIGDNGRLIQPARRLRTMTKGITILVVEDHEVVRAGLRILINSDPGLQIVGEASDGLKALRLARKLRPEIVLMDLAMPRSNGLQAAREICRQLPGAKVLVLSAYQDDETVQRVLQAGVAGYLTKHSAADELLAAIHQVSQGRPFYSRRIAERLRARQRMAMANGKSLWAGTKLTPREQEVVGLLASGQSNKEIAYNLHLSVKTVEKHRQAAMDKLNLHDIASLTRYAISHGLAGAAPTSSSSPSAQLK
jgi:DNA-binding NarL/FixJ family response regulator